MSEGDTIQHEEKINKISKIVLVFAAFLIVILGSGIVAIELSKDKELEPTPTVEDKYNEGFADDEAERYIPTEDKTTEFDDGLVGTDE